MQGIRVHTVARIRILGDTTDSSFFSDQPVSCLIYSIFIIPLTMIYFPLLTATARPLLLFCCPESLRQFSIPFNLYVLVIPEAPKRPSLLNNFQPLLTAFLIKSKHFNFAQNFPGSPLQPFTHSSYPTTPAPLSSLVKLLEQKKKKEKNTRKPTTAW